MEMEWNGPMGRRNELLKYCAMSGANLSSSSAISSVLQRER